MRFSSSVGIAAVVATLLALNPATAHGQVLGTTMSAVATADGQATEVTNGFVRVPELRGPDGTSSGSLELAVVLDPRTPVVNAREIAITLPAARIVVLENATHQFDVFGSSAIRAVLGQFLRGEVVTTEALTLPAIAFQGVPGYRAAKW